MKISHLLLILTALLNVVSAQPLWQEEQKLVANNREFDGRFGQGLAVDGNSAIIGGGGGGFPNVWFWERDSNGVWEETHAFWLNQGTTNTYGVDIHGNVAAVGKAGDFLGAGSIFIFERDSIGTWNLVQQITPSLSNDDDFFGESLSVWGESVVVGAESQGDTGKAFYFEKDSTGLWVEKQIIFPADLAPWDKFGEMVEMDSVHLAISAPGQDFDANGNSHLHASGAVYLFERDGFGQWEEKQKIVVSDRGNLDRFGGGGGSGSGYSYLSLSGNQLVVGAPSEEDGLPGDTAQYEAGSVYFFEKDTNGIWQEIQKVVPSDRNQRSDFGMTVAIWGDRAVVGSSIRLASGVQQEAAYVFQRIAGSWTEVQKIISPNGQGWNGLGNSLALQENRILIGAFGDSYDEFGQNFLERSGSVYAYDICAIRADSLIVQACESFVSPSGNFVWSSSGLYTDMLTSSLGCDSVVDINLTINTITSEILQVGNTLQADSSVGLYQWLDCANGFSPIPGANDSFFTPTQAGTYALEVSTPTKCADTSACIFLCIPPDTEVAQAGDSLISLAEVATYQWLDCQHAWVPIPGATDASFVPPSSGMYAIQVGQVGCLDTSACFAFVPTALESQDFSAFIQLFPNPSAGTFSLIFDHASSQIEVEVRNLLGQSLFSTAATNTRQLDMEIKAGAGLYLLEVRNQAGQTAFFKVLIE